MEADQATPEVLEGQTHEQLDRLSYPVIKLSVDGKVLKFNRKAEPLLSQQKAWITQPDLIRRLQGLARSSAIRSMFSIKHPRYSKKYLKVQIYFDRNRHAIWFVIEDDNGKA